MASTVPSGSKLRIRPAMPADVPDLVRIHFDAFGPGVMDHLMYPDGASASARALFGSTAFIFANDDAAAAAAASSLSSSSSSGPPSSSPSPVEHITMVAELLPEGSEGRQQQQQSPEIVAFGKWKLVKEPLPEEEVWKADGSMTAEQLGEGADAEVYNVFIGGLHRLRKKWMKGDPGLHLGILACTTARQRLGAGTALVTWGNELADKQGKVHWLEASPHGYALYKRLGFEDVEVQDLKVTELWGAVRGEQEDWGGKSAVELAGELPEGVFRTVVMRRFPRTFS